MLSLAVGGRGKGGLWRGRGGKRGEILGISSLLCFELGNWCSEGEDEDASKVGRNDTGALGGSGVEGS